MLARRLSKLLFYFCLSGLFTGQIQLFMESA